MRNKCSSIYYSIYSIYIYLMRNKCSSIYYSIYSIYIV